MSAVAQPTNQKSIHTILLDASPILLNTPAISTLTATCTQLVTTPAVISEIRGEEARTRFQTLYQPFIEVRTPKPESIKFVKDFARRTGDLPVLSMTDLEVLALAYDLECERNGGDWRLRNAPGQKRVNGSPPKKDETPDAGAIEHENASTEEPVEQTQTEHPEQGIIEEGTDDLRETTIDSTESTEKSVAQENNDEAVVEATVEATVEAPQDEAAEETVPDLQEDDSADSDSGWITPSNIKRKQAKDEGAIDTNAVQKTLQVATMTGDFAMQNVLLQINLNLLSTKTCKRITNIKQTIFRCHACFQTTKDMTKQFCPRCGKPTLTRVTCTTNDRGEVKLHLKQNYQWNNRGNVYSVPKPTAGTSNQKWQGPRSGGGQRGWGSGLILAEDQKEYQRVVKGNNRRREKDLMDEDILPGILTGERKVSDTVQVGAGRGVNSRKR